MSRSKRLFLSLLVVFAFVTACQALFEDQVGKDDWVKHHVGKVKYSDFDTRYGRKSSFVVTEQGVVAMLATNAQKDPIVWRRILPEGSIVNNFVKTSNELVLTTQSQAFVFDFDGNLIFQTAFSSSSPVSLSYRQGTAYLHVIEGTELRLYTSLKWNDVKRSKLPVKTGQTTKFVAVLSNGIETHFFAQDNSNVLISKHQNDPLVPVDIPLSSFINHHVVMTDKHLVFVDSKKQTISFVSLAQSASSVAPVTYNIDKQLLEQDIKLYKLTGSLVALNNAVFDFSGQKMTFEKESVLKAFCMSLSDCFISSISSNQLKIISTKNFKVVNTFELPTTKSSLLDSDQQTISSCAILPFMENGQIDRMALLVQRRDWLLENFEISKTSKSVVYWITEESLASVLVSTIVDLPAQVHEGLLVEETHFLTDFLNRLKIQFEQLNELFTSLYNLFTVDIYTNFPKDQFLTELQSFEFTKAIKTLSSIFSKNNRQQMLHKDHFGFRKLLIAATESGNVVAIHSMTKEIIWSTKMGINDFEATKIIIDKKSSTSSPKLTIFGKQFYKTSKEKANNMEHLKSNGRSYNWVSFELDVLTGNLISSHQYDFDILSIFKTNLQVNDNQQVLLFVDNLKQLRFVDYEKRCSAQNAKNSSFMSFQNGFKYYLVEESTGMITGYQFNANHSLCEGYMTINVESKSTSNNKASQSSHSDKTTSTLHEMHRSFILDGVSETWKVSLGSQIDFWTKSKISTFSPGKVTGSKDVLSKYLNPNAIAVGVTLYPASLASTSGHTTLSSGNQESVVQVSLVDTITGHLIHRFIQRSAVGRTIDGDESSVGTTHQGRLHDKSNSSNMKIIWIDHWLAFTYWSTKSHRFELTSAELFFKDGQLDSPDFDELYGHSYAIQRPIEVKQASFILLGGIRAISVTSTQQGIANQDLLLAYQNGHIQALTQKGIDPRRPLNEKDPDADPTLRPYFPYIPFDALSIVNYNNTFPHLHTILTLPTNLESTTVMWAIGLDSFFRLLAPRNESFDRLSHEYSFLSIIGITIALALATSIFNALSKKKELANQWK